MDKMKHSGWLDENSHDISHEYANYIDLESPSLEEHIIQNQQTLRNKLDHPNPQEKRQSRIENKILTRQPLNISMDKVRVHLKLKKGKYKETKNLNKFVFNEIKKHLRLLIITSQLSRQQVEVFGSFIRQKGKMRSYEGLWRHKILKAKCRELIESAQIVKNILRSERMEIDSKISAIKLLQQIRSICCAKTTAHLAHF